VYLAVILSVSKACNVRRVRKRCRSFREGIFEAGFAEQRSLVGEFESRHVVSPQEQLSSSLLRSLQVQFFVYSAPANARRFFPSRLRAVKVGASPSRWARQEGRGGTSRRATKAAR